MGSKSDGVRVRVCLRCVFHTFPVLYTVPSSQPLALAPSLMLFCPMGVLKRTLCAMTLAGMSDGALGRSEVPLA